MRCARYGLIAILLSILFLPLNALAVPLSDLIDLGASITAGDKLFTNFSGGLSGGGSPVLLVDVDVSGFSVGDTHGLSVIAPLTEPGALPGFSGGPGSVKTLNVGFDVTVTEGHNRITSIAVGIPFVTLIDAAVSAAAGGASVSAFGNHDGPLPADVFTFSSPVTGLHVEAGLFLMAQPTIDAFFQASGFDVSFVQSESVPEPSIVLLLVSGAGLIAAMAHKIRQA